MVKCAETQHDGRQVSATCSMSLNLDRQDRWDSAGYCLDAPESIPIGCTWRIISVVSDPYPMAGTIYRPGWLPSGE